MDQLNERQLQQHVMILGWLHIIGSIFFLAIAVFVFVLLTGIGVASGDSDAVAILSTVGTAVGAFLAILSIPGIVAGIGLLARKGWGRILAIVVGILNLVNVPIGTIMGVYTLWVLFQNPAADYFAAQHNTLAPT